MGPDTKKHLSESDVDLTDSDSLADEIAPKVRKSHKSKKKHKKHKSKQEKKKKHDYDIEDVSEKSHKKHKHKRKKQKKQDSDEENNGEVSSKRIRLLNDENGNCEPALTDQPQHVQNNDTDIKHGEVPISEAIDTLEKQKAMLQAALQDENGFEDGELSTADNYENGAEDHSNDENNNENDDDKHVSKKKKKKEKSRSKEEKSKKSKSKSHKETFSHNDDQKLKSR